MHNRVPGRRRRPVSSCAHREDLSRLFGGVAERVYSGASLGTEDEVARSQLLLASAGSGETGRPLSTKNISSAPKCMCIHIPDASGASSATVSPPSWPRPAARTLDAESRSFFVVSVPCVGEQVLTIHSCSLQVVAVARSTRGLESSLGPCANHARRSPRRTAISSPDPRRDRNGRALRWRERGVPLWLVPG